MTFLNFFLIRYLVKTWERDSGSDILKGRLGEMEGYLEHGTLEFCSSRNSNLGNGGWKVGQWRNLDECGEGQRFKLGRGSIEGKFLLGNLLNAGPQIKWFCPPFPCTSSKLFWWSGLLFRSACGSSGPPWKIITELWDLFRLYLHFQDLDVLTTFQSVPYSEILLTTTIYYFQLMQFIFFL